jgi:hypothetical protein
MNKRATILLATGFVAAIFSIGRVQAQPLPLGHVNTPVRAVSCPTGFVNGTSCYTSTVTCPDTEDLSFTYGVVNPKGTSGTIVFFSGEDGNTPGFSQYIAAYTTSPNNFQTVQVVWETAWEDTGNGSGDNLKAAACRPATVMDWILDQKNVYAGGAMCAQGSSAGSAAIGFALAEYGAGDYLNHVVLESGPVLSDVSTGCNPNSASMSVCLGNQCLTGGQGSWPDSPIYVDGAEYAVSTWTGAVGENACVNGSNISQAQYTAWKNMSIVDGLPDSTFSYPKTSVVGWLCDKPASCNDASCQNNSAAQAQLYYENVTSPKDVYRVDNCEGTEEVEAGTVPALGNESGLNAIIANMGKECAEPKSETHPRNFTLRPR